MRISIDIEIININSVLSLKNSKNNISSSIFLSFFVLLIRL